MAETTAQLQSKLLALTNGKVNIMLNADEFKSTTQILREMSVVWEDMTDVQQAAALELIGGKRQANILSSLISNFETVEDVIETSMNSSGSAIAENEKWLDSIEGKTYQFTNALQTMWSNMLDSETIKSFIDFGTDVIQFLDTGAGKVIALVAALKLMAKFKGFSIGGIAQGLGDTIKNITKAKQTLDALSSVAPVTGALSTESINAYAQAVAGLTAKQQANLLASQNLTKQDIQRVLQTNKCTEAEMREAMAHVRTTTTKTEEAAASQAIFTAKTQEMAATIRNSSATLTGVAADEAEIAVSILKTAASQNATKAELYEMITKSTLSAVTQQQIIAELGLVGAKTAETAANYNLLASIEALYASNPIGWILMIISAVIMLCQWYANFVKNLKTTEETIKDLNQEWETLSTEISTISDDFKSLKSSMDDIIPRFAELSDGVDQFGNNVSLTSEEYAEFWDLNNKIADMFPELDRGMDSNGNSMLNLSYSADTLTASLEAMVEVERKAAQQEIAKTMPDVLENISDTVDAYKKQLDVIEKEKEKLQETYDSILSLEDETITISSANQASALNERLEYLKDLGVKVTQEYIGSNGRDATYQISYDFDIDEVVQNYENAMAGLDKEIEDINAKIGNKWKDLNPVVTAYVETNYQYQTFNNDMQEVAKAMIGNLDFGNLTELGYDTEEEIQIYIRDYILNPIQKLTPAAQSAFSKLLSIDTNKKSVREYIDAIQSAAKAVADNSDFEYNDVLKNTGYEDIIEQYQTHAENIVKVLDDSIPKYYEKYEAGTVAHFHSIDEYQAKVQELKDKIYSLSPDELTKSFDIIKKYGIKTWDDLVEALENKTFDVVVDLGIESEGIENLLAAIDESVSATGLSSESIANLKSRYQDLENFDPSRLFEETTNGIHLNVQALRELEQAYKEQNKEALDNKLEGLVDQYNDLTIEIEGCADAYERATLYSQRQNIINQINDTANLATQYAGLTSAYNEWKNAQSGGSERDMYEGVLSGREEMDEELSRGWVDEGTRQYLELLSGQDLSAANYEEVLSVYKKLNDAVNSSGYSVYDFFTQDEDGNSTTDGIFNFFDAVKVAQEELEENWVKVNEEGQYIFDFGKGGDKAVAEALGISEELVQIVLRAAQDAGFEVNLDSTYTELADFKDEVDIVNERLKELEATDYTFNITSTDLDDLNNQITEAETALKNLKNEDGTLKVNVSEEDYKNAQTLLATLIYQKQTLDDSVILKVNVEDPDAGIETVVQKLQDFKAAYNELEVKTAIGADTTEAKQNVDAAIAALNQEDKQILADLGIDLTKSNEEINTAINAITVDDLTVKCGLDTTLIDEYAASEKTTTGEVVWYNNIDKVTAWMQQEHTTSGKVNWYNDTADLATYYTGNGVIYWKEANADGTAHSSGTAHAGGSWGAPKTETALVGELGPEMLVRNGRWTTVGDNGAEFTQVKKGDIIFNHKQTEDLLSKGYVTGRGKAYAQGNSRSFGGGGGTFDGENKRKWFDSGAFEGGWSWKNLGKTILGTANDIQENVNTAVLDATENLIDTVATGIGYAGELFSDGFKDKVGDFVKKDLLESQKTGETISKIVNWTNPLGVATNLLVDDTEEASVLGDKSDGLVQSVSHVVGSKALSRVGVPGWLTSGVNAFGSELENALNQGATMDQASISAAITAAANIITENIGGVKFQGKALSDIVSDKLSSQFSNTVMKKIAEVATEKVILGEGTEENISGVLSTIGQWATYKNDEKLSDMLFSDEALKNYIETYITSNFTSDIVDISGLDNIGNNNTQTLLDNINNNNTQTQDTLDDLVAMHNMSVEKFVHAYEQGGMASPSIALIKQEMSHLEFGGENGVRIRFPLSSIDPSLDPRNQVYGADAATPVVGKVPDVQLETYDLDKIRAIKRRIEYLNQLALEHADLSDHPGVDVWLEQPDSHTWESQLRKSTYGVSNNELISTRLPYNLAYDLTFDDKVRRAFLESNGIKIPTAIDDDNYDQPIVYPDSTHDYFDDATSWLQDMLQDAVIGKSEFTYNLNDLIEKMYQVSPDRVNSPLAARKYTSLEQILENAWRLNQDADGADGVYGDQVDDRLKKILLHYTRQDFDEEDGSEFNRWSNPQAIPERIQIADSIYEEGIRGIKEIKDAFAEAGEKLSIIDAYRLSKVFTESDNRQVNYFEAKPKRVVGFDEAISISVPEDFPLDVLKRMVDDGLNVEMRKGEEVLQLDDIQALLSEYSDMFAIQAKEQEISDTKNKIDQYKNILEDNFLNIDAPEEFFNTNVALMKAEKNKLATLEQELAALKAGLNDNHNDIVQNDSTVTDYNVEGTGADILENIKTGWENVPDHKTTTYTIQQYTGSEHISGGGRYTYADGTAHANGSFGAPKTETALVGELGPEMLVRNGRWTTIGENGAEFTQVKKGDIIFNHKQTQDLLSKGYITGRGKMHGSAAFSSGTAYSDTEVYGPGRVTVTSAYIDGGGAYRLDDAASSLDNAAGNVSDSADEFREVFDWIEVRLEEINESISLRSAELENQIGYQNQNKTVDKIIDLNQKLYDNLIAGSNRYYSYAEKLLTKVPEEYRKAAQDGTIAIGEFVGEADQKTLEAIQEYREWVQKGDEAAQQAQETLTEISNLAKQAIDNIAQDYDNKRSFRDNKIDQYEAYNGFLETDKGFESTSIYEAMIKENSKIIDVLQQQRDKMQAELNKRVESGEIEVGSQNWYDAVNDIAAVDTEIIELKTDTENYQDAINELHWDKFDALIKRLEMVSDEAENLIDILGNKDLVDESGNWTDEGITSLGLYAQQMEVAEVQAKKYKEEIDYLNKNWKKLGYTEEEYIEKLDELKSGQYDAIKAYHDSKDAIVDLNKERIDAIKEGIEKEIEAYEELIEKKKEELDAEKDLYDFQKSVMEQEKDIADLERQLASLSADNSASARAKRAQLEAELAEAQAALQESYYERSISNQQEALDKELENFKEEKDAEIEGWDEYLENTEKVVADSLDVIQTSTDAIYQTLLQMGQEYSLSITRSLTSPWTEGANAIQFFSEQFGISMSATVEELTALELQFKETMLEIEQAGVNATNTVKENAEGYTSAKYQEPKDDASGAGSGGGNSGGDKGSANAGLVSSISGYIQYGNTGDKVKKLQQALNELGYGNAGTTGLDGIFGDKTLAAVRQFQKDMGIAVDGIVGPDTKSKFKAKGYAKGSMGVDSDQWNIIDELGDELQLVPGKNGRLEYIKKGTGIVPADMTKRLVDMAMDPQMMLDQNRPKIGIHKEIHNTQIQIDNSIAELVHIDKCDQSTLPDVEKIVNKVVEQHTQRLNQSLRKYTR